MHKLKNKWIFLTLNLLLTLLLFFFFAPQYSLKGIINTLFYIDFLYLMLFLIMYVMKGRFFDGVTFGFRRFRAVMSKNPDYLDDWQERAMPSEIINETFYAFIKFQAVSLLFIMVFLLGIYYL
ncbi:DUF3899 domain-containing protein [Salirhabdus sp. Marseille-P4669]|uniref:DUF3899 domain-containing protein n=1 Tax=Salirhabdus sp. Marseille-P4669 TaxID=2042310 RepID=UPI000C7D8CDF|nr:DUF3899 domain-containing protein [Salirhabdus sp. Marseille-P4669]